MSVASPPLQVRVPQAEALLDELDLSYSLQYVEIAEIDTRASRQNQARTVAITDERAERYRRSFEAGAVFPAGLIGKNGRNRLVIADMNHRHEAFLRAGATGCWAYVFDYETEAQFRAVADIANVRLNGAENTPEEKLMHAIYALNNSNITRQAAAREFGVTENMIAARVKFTEALPRLAALGIKPSEYAHLTEQGISEIAGAAADECVKFAFYVAKQAGYTKVKHALRDANASTVTEADRISEQRTALEIIDASFKATAAALVTPKKKITRSPKDVLTMHLRGAEEAIRRALAASKLTEEQQETLDRIKTLLG